MDSEARSLSHVVRTYRAHIIATAVAVLVIAAILIGWFAYPSSSAQTTQALDNATNAFNQNNFQAALKVTNGLLAKDPHNVQALITKATILAQEGSLQFKEQQYGTQAQQLAQQAIALAPKSSEAYRILGYSYEIRQMYPQAHQAYETAIKLDPKNALAIFDEAHAYDLQGSTTEAAAGYQDALTIYPNLAAAHRGLGRILVGEGDLPGALQQFKNAYAETVNLHSKSAAAYSIASIELALGDIKAASDFASESTKLDPTYPLAWTGLGMVRFHQALASTTASSSRQTLIQQSLSDLNKAITLNPDQSLAHLQFAIELASLGETANAINILKKDAAIVPNDITLSSLQKKNMLLRIEAAQHALQKS